MVDKISSSFIISTMGLYTIHNCYADKYFEHLEYVDNLIQTPSMVDFGTAMANKRRTKRNKRK